MFNANIELIPEAPNRQAIFLSVVLAARSPIVVQREVPSIVSTVLRRTPPVTAVANGAAVISTEDAVTARKTSK